MVVEVFTNKFLPGGSQNEAIKQWRVLAQFVNSTGVKSRVLLHERFIHGASETGDRIFLQMEFESRKAWSVWWDTHRNTEELNTAHKGVFENTDRDTTEHYIYYEPPE